MTGSSDPRTSQRKDNCLIDGFQPVKNLTLKNNRGFLLNSRGSRLDQIIDGGGNNFTSSPPTAGKHIVVSQNKYDAGRARVVIYNYDNENNVSVDVRSVLKVGEAYRIHSSFGLFNNPLVTGLYDGSDVIIPNKTFGVFVITHGVCK